jgi:spore coat protein A
MDILPVPPKISAIPPNPKNLGTISMNQGTHQFHSQFLTPVPSWGYAGAGYLGPTIEVNSGTPITIKWVNNLPQIGNHLFQGSIDPTIPKADVTDTNIPAVVHLHGGHNYAKFDGTPMQWFTSDPAQNGEDFVSNTFKYPNDQPSSTMWYHDHAYGFTRHNVYAGLAAFYLIRDPIEMDLINGTNNSGKNPGLQKIPSGYGTYEYPIAIQDKIFNPDGSMFYPTQGITAIHPIWIPEFFGDTPVINGKAYPYLDVEPRRYRFRFVNGSQARFYNIWFDNGLGPVPFWVIGSDGGFLPNSPAKVNKLLISPGERFDIIFDFSNMLDGTLLTLNNNAKAPYPGGRGGEIPHIMQFKVVKPFAGDDTTPGDSLVLPPLNPDPLTVPVIGALWREIVIQENADPLTGEPVEALLNNVHYDVGNPPMFSPVLDDTEVWQFINMTGDAHPMHTHLVMFQVLDRQPFDLAGFTAAWNAYIAGGPKPTINNFLTVGPKVLPPKEETGWKDTAKVYPGEILRVIAKFDRLGKYVCHCHILEHEENDMMFEFEVHN